MDTPPDSYESLQSRPLVVTSRPYAGSEWADVARTAAAGLQLWRERRHAVVFADFGDLGLGVSGVRLTKLIRNECKRTRVYLFSDKPDEAQRTWARANGADDIVCRDPQAIAECLAGLPRSAPPPERPPLPVDPIEALAMQVMPLLIACGEVGPSTHALALDVIEDFVQQNHGRLPTISEVALLVRAASRIAA